MTRSPSLLTLAGLIAAGPLFAAPGELDAAFGNNGRMTIALTGPSFGGGGVQQADGKLLLVGGTENSPGDSDIAVLRLNIDGTLDTTFGTGGVATSEFADTYDEAYVLLLQDDGRMVAVGQSASLDFSEFVIAMARFNADGSVDTTFGTDGRVTFDLGGSDDYAYGGVLLPDGRIVIAGASDVNGDYDTVVVQFNADGSVDSTFGVNGSVLVDSGGRHNQANWLARQPDGKLIACGLGGTEPYSPVGGDMEVVRLNTDGSIDTEFGTDGVATVVTGTQLGMALGCTVAPDETIVLAGLSGSPEAADVALARLTASGTLDATFGPGGQSHLDLGGAELAVSVIVLPDGRLGVTGLVQDGDDGDPADLFFARIATDGSLDPTFGRSGITIADFGNGGSSSQVFPNGLLAQSDGKLVAVGTAFGNEQGIAVARVEPDGSGSIGVVGFRETSTTVDESDAGVVLTVRRTGGSVGAFDVEVAFADGTASAPEDYTSASLVLSWADGDMSDRTVTIPITDDSEAEDFETFDVILSTFTPGLGLAATTATVLIGDADAAAATPRPQTTSGGGGGSVGLGWLALLGLGLLRLPPRCARMFAS